MPTSTCHCRSGRRRSVQRRRQPRPPRPPLQHSRLRLARCLGRLERRAQHAQRRCLVPMPAFTRRGQMETSNGRAWAAGRQQQRQPAWTLQLCPLGGCRLPRRGHAAQTSCRSRCRCHQRGSGPSKPRWVLGAEACLRLCEVVDGPCQRQTLWPGSGLEQRVAKCTRHALLASVQLCHTRMCPPRPAFLPCSTSMGSTSMWGSACVCGGRRSRRGGKAPLPALARSEQRCCEGL